MSDGVEEKDRGKNSRPSHSLDANLTSDEGKEALQSKPNILKALPSRQLSLWKRRSRDRLRQMRRGRSKDYEMVGQDEFEGDELTEEQEARKRKFDLTEPLSVRLMRLRQRRYSSAADGPRSQGLSSFTAFRLHVAMLFKRGYSRTKEFLNSYELWRGHFKEIEGTFGNGVLSYFTFLKWILQLNIFIFILTLSFVIIPQAVSTGKELPLNAPINATSCNVSDLLVSNSSKLQSSNSSFIGARNESAVQTRRRRDILPAENITEESIKLHCDLQKPDNYYNYTHKPFAQLASDFISGIGWINTTLMFYGSYSAQVLVLKGKDSYYNMPLAYFVVGCVCFLVILLSILLSASQIFEESYVKEGSKHFHTYTNKVFGGWDMCIEDEEAAHVQSRRIIKEIEADLEEDMRVATLAKMTQREKYQMYAIRVLVNLVVLGLSVLAAYLIFFAAQISINASQNDMDVESSATTDVIVLLKSYASPITLSTLGFVVPQIFFFLSRFENWNPRAKVNVDLARTVLLKLASIAVLIVSLYNRILKTCMLCWENAIAAEMYKLVWTDFFVTIAVIVAVHTPKRYFADYVSLGCDLGKKIGRPQFILPDNVLELVYGQSLIWIGTWYSPMLPVMAIVKLPIVFYAKKATVVYNCQFQEKAYRAGRSNYFFMILLLGTFLFCLCAVAYGITQIRPSELYGPFRGLNEVYDIIPWTVSILPGGLRDTFNVVSSPVFLVVLAVVICLALYFFYAMAKVYRRMIDGLREELNLEARDKQFLLQKFTSGDA